MFVPSKIPILVGPTGVGKSEIAYRLAKRLNAEIISADAFQVYKGLEIGTAQPSKEWQKEIPHHLIGIRDPKESWNAVEFAREAKKIIDALISKGKRPLLVGGAGFYLRALVEGAPAGTSPKPEIRSMVMERVRELGNEKALAWLKERDREAGGRLHANDLQRICRALEKTFDTEQTPTVVDYRPLGVDHVLFLGFERSKDKLDVILRTRGETMWRDGLLEESRELMEKDLSFDHAIWGAIGYSEAAAFLKGKMAEPYALERLFRRTRQYAKRQWTWFKHQHDVQWFNLDNFESTDQVLDVLIKMI